MTKNPRPETIKSLPDIPLDFENLDAYYDYLDFIEFAASHGGRS